MKKTVEASKPTVFEGVSFNTDYWKGKTEAEFLEHESHHDLTKDQLKEAFAAINKEEKAEDGEKASGPSEEIKAEPEPEPLPAKGAAGKQNAGNGKAAQA